MRTKIRDLYEQYQKSYVAKGAIASLIIQVFSMLLTVISGIIIARWLGETSFGEYSYLANWIQILYVIGLMGWYDLLMKDLPPYIATQEHEKRLSLVQKSFFFSLISSLTVILVWFLLIQLHLLEGILTADNRAFWTIIAIPFAGFMTLQQVILRSYKQVALAQIPEKILRPLLLIMIGSLGYFTTNLISNTTNTAIFWASTTYIIVSLVGFIFIFNKTPHSPLILLQKPNSSYTIPYKELSYLGLLSLIGLFYHRIDTVFLGELGYIHQVGIYNIASRFSDLVPFFFQAILGVIAPLIATYWQTNKINELQKLLTKTTSIVFLVTIPLFLVLIIGGKHILAWHGEGFVIGYEVLVISAITQLYYVFCGHNAYILMMIGRADIALKGMGASLLISVIFYWLLIPPLGMLGAILAKLIGTTLWHTGMLFLLYKYTGLKGSALSWIKWNK